MSIKFGDKTFRTPEEQIKKNMENIESINKVDTDFEKSTNENEIKLTSSYDLSYLYLNKEDTEILSFTYSKL